MKKLCGCGSRESWGNTRNQRQKINKVRGGSEEGSETSSEDSSCKVVKKTGKILKTG